MDDELQNAGEIRRERDALRAEVERLRDILETERRIGAQERDHLQYLRQRADTAITDMQKSLVAARQAIVDTWRSGDVDMLNSYEHAAATRAALETIPQREILGEDDDETPHDHP